MKNSLSHLRGAAGGRPYARHGLPGSDAGADGQTLTIGDLAREFGVTLRTLRFYEDRGLLSPLRQGTARFYGATDRTRLAMILKGKQLGFTLTEISAMLGVDRNAPGQTAELSLSLDQVHEQIAHLERQKDEIEDAITELRLTRERLAAMAAE